jgi:integrase
MSDALSAILETTAERLATGVQQQLGHASISQPADTYGHVQPERHEAAVENLDRYVNAWGGARG